MVSLSLFFVYMFKASNVFFSVATESRYKYYGLIIVKQLFSMTFVYLIFFSADVHIQMAKIMSSQEVNICYVFAYNTLFKYQLSKIHKSCVMIRKA